MAVKKAAQTLSDRPPRDGDKLVYLGQAYAVTGSSHYKEDDYQTTEWCCETGDSECYLLRETQAGKPVRWFFTHWISPKEVSLGEGGAPPSWALPDPPPEPPKTLTARGESFAFDDKTDGMFDDEDGERLRKITWDYWDPGRKKNLALELWADGKSDFYLGVYIAAEEVVFSADAADDEDGGAAKLGGWFSGGLGIFAILAALTAVAYLFFMLFFGLPFDECLAASLAVSSLMTLALLPGRKMESGLTLAVAALAALGLWHFAPLATLIGMAVFLAAPILLALALLRLQTPLKEARFFCFFAGAAPSGLCGFLHYFYHAPGPHSGTQLALALAPALAGGAAGLLLASFLLDSP